MLDEGSEFSKIQQTSTSNSHEGRSCCCRISSLCLLDRIVEDDSNRSPWETVRVCAKPINESWESCRTSPARRLLAIFCCVVCSWELPPSIRFRFTRKLECTGLCQRFMGKRLVVARKDISTPSTSYLRNCKECLLELPKQWQLVYSTRFRHWRRMNPCTAARKTSG